MSLNLAEQERTRAELRANYELTGYDAARVTADLGFTAEQLADILDLRRADPADVWLMRDYLDREVRASGRTPVPFSKLTESARAAAAMWFDLRPLPAAR